MIEKIRKFDIRKAGYVAIGVGTLAIIVHILVMAQLLPYTWINGGRSISYQAAYQTSFSSMIMIFINILITLIASKIIPIKLNRICTIVLIIWLWIGIPLDMMGIIQQFLGTVFEKTCMSILTIMGCMMDLRIALEKRL